MSSKPLPWNKDPLQLLDEVKDKRVQSQVHVVPPRLNQVYRSTLRVRDHPYRRHADSGPQVSYEMSGGGVERGNAGPPVPERKHCRCCPNHPRNLFMAMVQGQKPFTEKGGSGDESNTITFHRASSRSEQCYDCKRSSHHEPSSALRNSAQGHYQRPFVRFAPASSEEPREGRPQFRPVMARDNEPQKEWISGWGNVKCGTVSENQRQMSDKQRLQKFEQNLKNLKGIEAVNLSLDDIINKANKSK